MRVEKIHLHIENYHSCLSFSASYRYPGVSNPEHPNHPADLFMADNAIVCNKIRTNCGICPAKRCLLDIN
jgi:hypothetical protein